jgi:tetratricopeptide (TPR) repeat protein
MMAWERREELPASQLLTRENLDCGFRSRARTCLMAGAYQIVLFGIVVPVQSRARPDRHLNRDLSTRQGEMNLQYLSATLLLFPAMLLAQIGMDAASGSSGRWNPDASHEITLTGTVKVDGGSALPSGVTVVLRCGNEVRAHANATARGDFAITISQPDSDLQNPHLVDRAVASSSYLDCELDADSPGYTSEGVRMSNTPDRGMVQVGVILLHPMASDHSFMISATSLAAPESAKKSFEKGQQQARKEKWAAACGYFEKAIQEYPRYALAWVELGWAQFRQNHFAEAQQSFQQAITQDSHFIDAYAGLAELALEQKQWKELKDATSRLVGFAPNRLPRYWFLNSAANYNLGNTDAAEASAVRGLHVDSGHQVPQLEFLYAMILAHRENYSAAVEHLQNYLRLAPHAGDVSLAQSRLAEFQKLAESLASSHR